MIRSQGFKSFLKSLAAQRGILWQHRSTNRFSVASEHKRINDSQYFFDVDTSLVKKADLQYSAFVTDRWSVGDAPNGGYLMAIAISAALDALSFSDPMVVTGSFFTKANENAPLDISVTPLSETRSSATVMITFHQNGVLRSHYTGTFGNLNSFNGLSFNNLTAPTLPPIEQCLHASSKLREHLGDKLKVAERAEFYVPKKHAFVRGAMMHDPSVKEAELDCWVAFADGRTPCLRSLAFFCDGLPPPVLNVASSNWVPTLQYTVHFWRRPKASFVQLPQDAAVGDESRDGLPQLQWMRGRFVTPISTNSLLYTDGELWSADGTELLASSRQIARLLTPR